MRMRLERSKFEQWLKAKRPDEIVGKNRDCCGCPIARFYLEATGGHEVIISNDCGEIYIDRGDGSRRLPDWADRFVRDVDMDDEQDISATRALAILVDVRQ
jgi:hypothetical protein